MLRYSLPEEIEEIYDSVLRNDMDGYKMAIHRISEGVADGYEPPQEDIDKAEEFLQERFNDSGDFERHTALWAAALMFNHLT